MIFFIDPLKRGNMLQVWMFGIFQVVQNRTCSYNTIMKIFNSKSFQTLSSEMFQQTFLCISLSKNPFIQSISVKFAAKPVLKIFLLVPLKYNFCRLETLK